MEDSIRVTRDRGVTHVLLNRPSKKNALNGAMFSGLIDAAHAIAADEEVRAVVISGAGGCFCSGLDFSSFAEMAAGELTADSSEVAEAAEKRSRDGANGAQQIAWLWQELPVPVIAAVEGAAYGGGFHIALGADLRIVAPDARIAFVEITWGLVPDLSGTQALRRLVPLDVAKRLIFTGEPISGSKAYELHLATELADKPTDVAFELARRIADLSPDAVRAAKKLLNASALVPLDEGLANEFRASGALMGSANQIEAVTARLEGRSPRFSNPVG